MFGREKELARLEELASAQSFQMLVLYGRRRVGKTTLITEFARHRRALFFTALEQSDANNLADFSAEIQKFFELPQTGPFESWQAAFNFLAARAAKDPFLFIFDEFPYAAQRSEAMVSALQVCIDHRLKKTQMFMILCGSNQGFMESDVLGRKSPLYGRRTAQMRLGPLNFLEARQMLAHLDAQDAFRFYGCFGGVPYYLTQLDPNASLAENLERLYFSPSGFLYGEPLGLLRQELSEPALYNSILRAIAAGANKPSEIASRTGIAQTSLPRYLGVLVDLGIVERVVPFGQNAQTSKRGVYRIVDACFDFWFRFVMPFTGEIEAGLGHAVVRALPEAQLDEYLGRRFERLCAEWLVEEACVGALSVPATSVGSWWGTNAATRQQTDIDVLAADRIGKTLMLCECKYREEFNVSETAGQLVAKAGLVNGYESAAFCIFSKHEVAAEIQEDACEKYGPLQFVSLAQMYAEE